MKNSNRFTKVIPEELNDQELEKVVTERLGL